jgi:hypothetical protein
LGYPVASQRGGSGSYRRMISWELTRIIRRM